MDAPASVDPGPTPLAPGTAAAGAAVAAGVIAIGIGLGAWLSRQPPPPEVRFDIPPDGDEVRASRSRAMDTTWRTPRAVSLRLRNLNDETSAPLEPPLGARNPFFSS